MRSPKNLVSSFHWSAAAVVRGTRRSCRACSSRFRGGRAGSVGSDRRPRRCRASAPGRSCGARDGRPQCRALRAASAGARSARSTPLQHPRSGALDELEAEVLGELCRTVGFFELFLQPRPSKSSTRTALARQSPSPRSATSDPGSASTTTTPSRAASGRTRTLPRTSSPTSTS